MHIITEYKDQQEWNKFVIRNTSPVSFLQSWEWGEFNEKILSQPIQRWAVVDTGEIRIIFTLIKKELPFGKSYYYCPRGLIWQKEYADKRANSYDGLLSKARTELNDGVFMRACPPSEFKDYVIGFMKRLKFRRPKILTYSKEPATTWVLDLKQSEEELLKNMHSKTRYNIRLAEKKGVKIRIMNYESRIKNIDIFYKLAKQTAKRNKIKIYNKDYYTKLVDYFGKRDKDVQLKVYMAEYQHKPLSSIIVIYFGNTATYLHGASADEHRELMPNHLIQWQAIQDAKQAGLELYDFWGINKKKWPGVTRFKKGFGGREIKMMGCWDYVLDRKWYTIFRILKVVKKLILI